MIGGHYCRLESSLSRILALDDYEKFIELYETKESLLNEINTSICNHVDRKKCKDEIFVATLLSRNLKLNQNRISTFIIKKYGINLLGMDFIVAKYKRTKSIEFKNQLKTLLINSLLNFNNCQDIFQKIFECQDWDLIDLFHGLGYRLKNIIGVVGIIPYNKILQLLSLDYKFDTGAILQLINDHNIYESSLLAKIGFSQKMITNANNKVRICKLYKNNSIKLIKFIEHNEFVSDNECLDNAINGYNFDVILHLIKSLDLFEENIYKLFFVEKCKKKVNKKKIRRRRRYANSMRIHRKLVSIGNKIKKIQNYEKGIFNIMDIYEIPIKILDDIFKRSIDYLIYGNCFKLVTYMANKLGYDLKSYIKNDTINNIIDDIITKDSVDNMKALFLNKLVMPIEISMCTHWMDRAIRRNSSNIIDYFSKELKMVCSQNMHTFIDRYGVNHLSFVNNLIKVDFPINNTIIKCLARNSKFNVISVLIDKGYVMPTCVVDYAILCKKYNIANKLLVLGTVINKKNYIDRLIKCSEERHFFRYYTPASINSKKQIDYMISLGCTSSNKNIANIFAKKGLFDMVIYINVLFGYKPDVSVILSFFTNYRSARKMDEGIIMYLEKFRTDMKLGIFDKENFDNFKFKNFCNVVSENAIKLLPVFKYFVEKSNTKLTLEHLRTILSYIQVSKNGLDEIFELFEKHDVYPGKDFLIESLQQRSISISKYVINRYKFTLNIKDIHNFINSFDFDIETLIAIVDIMNIKPTPYTTKLVVDGHHRHWHRTRFLEAFILLVKKMTCETYNKILISEDKKLIKFIKNNKNIKIVDYEPKESEIPDIPQAVIHNFDDDYDSDSDSGEKDYVDQILDEYKI